MQKLIYTLLFLLPTLSLLAQGAAQVEFGKNRVQYHDDFAEWSQYESDNFITYWYGEGRYVGQAVVQLAEYDFKDIQNILEHRINEKIQIIVYTDLTDLKQSNIGSEEAFTNTGGQTKIVGNKVFVYFNGDHNDLRRQVREGIASVYLNAMLFGSNLQEIVQNAVMMNLPEWFKEGLVSYVGQTWNAGLDNRLRDYILREDFEGFEALAEEDPRLAGHSLWYFIGENYGRSTVSNLLYLTRINRSIESGFLYVLGSPYEMVGDSWAIFYRKRYVADVASRSAPGGQPLAIRNKRNLPITEMKLSPDGTRVVYVTNEIGKYRVYLQNVATGDREVIFRGGFRNAFQATDYNYPLLAWNPNNQQVAILYERRDIPKLMAYDVNTKKATVEDLSTEYHRVYSMEYINPVTMVFSAAVRGISDIFLYYTNTRQTQRITNDFWDDLDPVYVQLGASKGILFASNRQDSLLEQEKLDSILPISTYDIFYYDLETRSRELVKITHTPHANERSPAAADTAWFSYLSDRTGIYNREMGYLEEYIHHYEQVISLEDGTEIRLHIDSTLEELDTALIDTILVEPVIKKRAVTHINSNYDRNILRQSSAPRVDRVAELVLRDGRHQAFVRKMYPDSVVYSSDTHYHDKRSADKGRAAPPEPLPDKKEITLLEEVDKVTADEIRIEPVKQDTGKVDIDNYLFQSEFDDDEAPPPVIMIEEEKEAEEEEEKKPLAIPEPRKITPLANGQDGGPFYRFRPSAITPYRLQFRTDYVTTQLDNSLLFDGLNSFAANPEEFNYPPPGILLKANFKDLFEDYEFEGGVRIPTTFNGSEYFLVLSDKKKRLDKQFAVYRRNQRFSGEAQTFVPNRREVNVVLGQAGVRYPLDIFRSLRATGTLRRDRTTQLATDLSTYNVPSVTEERIGLKLEYVFDNTLDVALNLKNGARYKAFAEIVKRFDLDVDNRVSLSFNEGFMTILGFDARHYQRMLKHSVFAVRMAGATSFGSEKILYYLGGVDNWLFTSFNQEIPSPQVGEDFAYQALATNMRGFDLNIRNGNSYLLMNAEARIPIFKYFSKRIRSPFFRNFQVVGFFDLGTAWEGSDPFSTDNPLNTSIVNNGNLIQVKVNYFRDPVVAGYGLGARAVLFGYLVRVDYAWGIETRRVQDPKLYISLGMDF